jgi:hypothetical protein
MAALVGNQEKVQPAFRSGEGVAWGDQAFCLICATARFFHPGLPQQSGQQLALCAPETRSLTFLTSRRWTTAKPEQTHAWDAGRGGPRRRRSAGFGEAPSDGDGLLARHQHRLRVNSRLRP